MRVRLTMVGLCLWVQVYKKCIRILFETLDLLIFYTDSQRWAYRHQRIHRNRLPSSPTARGDRSMYKLCFHLWSCSPPSYSYDLVTWARVTCLDINAEPYIESGSKGWYEYSSETTSLHRIILWSSFDYQCQTSFISDSEILEMQGDPKVWLKINPQNLRIRHTPNLKETHLHHLIHVRLLTEINLCFFLFSN